MSNRIESALRQIDLGKCLAAALLLLVAGGCATPKPKPKYLFYPPRPDEPRLQYLTGFSTETEFFGESGFKKFIVGAARTEKTVGKPYGIAARRNQIFYCDSGIPGVGILDLDKQAMEIIAPNRENKMLTPINAASDAQGNIYVTDTEREQVLIYGPDRSPQEPLGRKGEMKPCGLAISKDNLYVSDLKNHQVRIYRLSDRTLVRTIPRQDASATFSVADLVDLPSLANRLKKPADALHPDPVSTYLRSKLSAPTWSALTNYQDVRSDPVALQTSLVGDLNRIIGDESIYNAQRFTNTFVTLRPETQELLAQNPQGAALVKLNRLLLEDAYPLEISRNQLFSPVNVAVDQQGKVYVADPGSFRVQVYDAEGKFLRTLGRQGIGPGQLARPRGIAVDHEGRVYVVDGATQVVQLFDSEGRLLIFFGDPSITGPGATSLPAGVAVDYENVGYFEKYVAPGHKLEYVVLLTNQYGDPKISAYGFLKKP